jgi:splicing factor 3B subunit 3
MFVGAGLGSRQHSQWHAASACAEEKSRLCFFPSFPSDLKVLAIAEADHAAIPLSQREDLKLQHQQQQQQQQQQQDGMETDQQNGAAAAGAAMPGPEMDEETAAREDQWAAPKGEPGQWASCVR